MSVYFWQILFGSAAAIFQCIQAGSSGRVRVCRPPSSQLTTVDAKRINALARAHELKAKIMMW